MDSKKAILRTSVIDRHGDFIALEEMVNYVEIINSDEKMRYLINHRRDIPPMGYWNHAELVSEDNVCHVIAEPIEFGRRSVVDFESGLLLEDAGAILTLSRRGDDDDQEQRIAVDKNNFISMEAVNDLGQKLYLLDGEPMKLELNMRKSYLPDPQMVVTLVEYYFVLYPLLSPFLKKFGEKFAEDMADDVYQATKRKGNVLIKKLKESLRLVRSAMIPKDKVMVTIFEIPGDVYMELHLKSDDPADIDLALKESKLFKIHQKLMHFQGLMDVTEIYFSFNAKKKWEFSYLINSQGQVLGTKAAFSKRDKLAKRISLSPTKAFSMGADKVIYEKRNATKK